MLLNAYSIFDNKALQYHTPFFASTDGAAVRSLTDLVSDSNTTIGRHPGDYILYRVGYWDDNKGQFGALDPLQHVIDAVALVKIQATLPFAQANGQLFAEKE